MRGGKRKGAGRPAQSGIPRRRLTVALREDLLVEMTHQAKALKISLNDHLNHLLAAQLQLSVFALDQTGDKEQIEKSTKKALVVGEVTSRTNKDSIAQTLPLPFEENQGGDLAVYDQLLKQVDDFDRELEALPLDDDEAPAVPTSKELEVQLRAWTSIHINRHSKEVQYWRKQYRQDKAFRKAMDHLAAWTHERFRDLVLDNRLPLASHDEALALSLLPAKALKITAVRLLQGERDLKQALKGYEETFRQAVTHQRRETDPSRSAYRFESELGF